jgi:hypothetical protein
MTETDNTGAPPEAQVTASGPSRGRRLFAAATSFLWLLVLIVYFAVSFLTGDWHITWLVFIVGAILQQVITAVFSANRRGLAAGMLYTSAAVVYVAVSFLTEAWHITWLIFLAAAAVHQAARFIKILREPQQ